MDSHATVREFKARHAIDEAAFKEWFADGGYSQEEANVHDSRYLALLENFVEERDGAQVPSGR